MLAHRAKILELTQSEINGYPVHQWKPVQTQALDPSTDEPLFDEDGEPVMIDLVVPCFLDLNFIRKGKDPVWTPEAGRASDRSGVGFFRGDAPLTAASRIQMVKGPEGTFSVEMAVDEAWTPNRKHHLEVGVTEVAKQIAGGP